MQITKPLTYFPYTVTKGIDISPVISLNSLMQKQMDHEIDKLNFITWLPATWTNNEKRKKKNPKPSKEYIENR